MKKGILHIKVKFTSITVVFYFNGIGNFIAYKKIGFGWSKLCNLQIGFFDCYLKSVIKLISFYKCPCIHPLIITKGAAITWTCTATPFVSVGCRSPQSGT